MRAKTNDRFRQKIINDLSDVVTSDKLWLVLGYDSNRQGNEVSSRANEDSIGNTIYKRQISAGDLRKALKKLGSETPPSITPSDFTEQTIAGVDYYISTDLGLTGGDKLSKWNAIFGSVPITEKNEDPLTPTYYNTISVVITNDSTGTINTNTIIVSQSFITKTTLPYDTNQYMQILIQF